MSGSLASSNILCVHCTGYIVMFVVCISTYKSKIRAGFLYMKLSFRFRGFLHLTADPGLSDS